MSDNPYEGTALAKSDQGSSIQVEANRALGEVQAQVIMAKRYPRDPVIATERILADCDRMALAESAVYNYPRGDTRVEGASIRLAEDAARQWGNLSFGITELERRGEESSVLAYAWDLETNTMARKEFKVKHIRDSNRGGKQIVTAERDIYEVVANSGARRLRACILAVIPGDVIDAAVSRSKKTLATKFGDIPSAIKAMTADFESLGVTKLMLEKRLRHRLEATQAAEIVSLNTIFNSITDGMGSVPDYFEAEEGAEPKTVSAADKAKQALEASKKAPAGKEPPKPVPAQPQPASAKPLAPDSSKMTAKDVQARADQGLDIF